MSKNYDNWEKLVDAVLRREQWRKLAQCNSETYSSFSSARSSSFGSISQISETLDDQEMIWTTDYLSFFLDQRTGKKCYMLGARELIISWGDNPKYWKWTPRADSRFPEVAELESVWWLDIRGKIKTILLSPRTRYAAFLVFKLAERSQGLGLANAILRFVDDEPDEIAEKRANIIHLQIVEKIEGQVADSRADGWMEVEMGNFYVDEGGEEEVEVRLLETRSWKIGLIVQGFEFRPTYKVTSLTSGRKKKEGKKVFSVFQMMKTNV